MTIYHILTFSFFFFYYHFYYHCVHREKIYYNLGDFEDSLEAVFRE